MAHPTAPPLVRPNASKPRLTLVASRTPPPLPVAPRTPPGASSTAHATTLEISFFSSVMDNKPKTRTVPWPSFFEDNPKIIKKRDDKNTLSLWQPSIYAQGTTRSNINVQHVTAFVQDFDYKGQTVSATASAWSDYACLIHTTASHTDAWNKYRVIVPLSRPMSPAEHTAMWRWVEDQAKTKPDICPKNTDARAISQPMYLPCVVEGVETAGSWYYDGPLFDPDVLAPFILQAPPNKEAPNPRARPLGTQAPLADRVSAEEMLRGFCAHLTGAVKGTRHPLLLKLGYTVGGLVAAGRLTYENAFDQLVEAKCAQGEDPGVAARNVEDQLNAGMEHPLWGEADDAEWKVAEVEAFLTEARKRLSDAMLAEATTKATKKFDAGTASFQKHIEAVTEVAAAREHLREVRADLSKAKNEAKKAASAADKLAKKNARQAILQSVGDPATWQRLDMTSTGLPEPTLHNLVTILDTDPVYKGHFSYDTFAEKIVYDTNDMTDYVDTSLNCQIQAIYRLNTETGKLREAIQMVAHYYEFHPVCDYLNALEWDGVERLPELMTTGFRVTNRDPDVLIDAGVKFAISAVARVLPSRDIDGNGGPGCKVDTLVVFVGAQGSKKSTAFAALASPLWFSDTAIDLTSKDAYMQIQGTWLYELSELDSLKKAEHSRTKSFISSQVDKYRPPYGHHVERKPRQVVLVGTTNEEQFLSDSSGSRRFVPVMLPNGVSADLSWLRTNRDQLWAEAKARYDAGESWWYEGEESERLARQSEAHNQEDGWDESVLQHLKNMQSMPVPPGGKVITTNYMLLNAIGMVQKDITPRHMQHMASVLKRLGYAQAPRPRIVGGGIQPRTWVRTEALPVEPPLPAPTPRPKVKLPPPKPPLAPPKPPTPPKYRTTEERREALFGPRTT